MAAVRGRTNVDFTDENLLGLGVPAYTSFEPRTKQQQMAAAAAGLGGITGGIRNIEISLGNNGTEKKSVASRLKSNVIELNLTPPQVPADVPTYTYVIDPSKLVCFYGREHFLSSYFMAPMTVNNVAYRTVEHYYEACKLFSFGGFQWSSQLSIIKDPGAVKVTGKRLMAFIDRRRVEAWKRQEGLAVIENALLHKFVQHSDLGDKLLETGDSYLAHCNPYDTLWGTGLKPDQVKQWASTNAGTSVKIPRHINAKTLQYFPLVGNGQNALGYLLMQIRDVVKRRREKASGIVTSNDVINDNDVLGDEDDDDQSDDADADVVEIPDQQQSVNETGGTGSATAGSASGGPGSSSVGTGTACSVAVGGGGSAKSSSAAAANKSASAAANKLSPENAKALEDISYKMALANITGGMQQS